MAVLWALPEFLVGPVLGVVLVQSAGEFQRSSKVLRSTFRAATVELSPLPSREGKHCKVDGRLFRVFAHD